MIREMNNSGNKHLRTVDNDGIGKLAERVSYNVLPPIINMYVDTSIKNLVYLKPAHGFP